MRALVWTAVVLTMLLGWSWLAEHLPALLVPGFALTDWARPLPPDAADAEITAYLGRVRDNALVFWCLVVGIAFIVSDPRHLRGAWHAFRGQPVPHAEGDALVGASRQAGAVVRGAAAIGAAAAHDVAAATHRGVQRAAPVLQPAAAVASGAGGFLAWLVTMTPWLAWRAVVAGIAALAVAGMIGVSPVLGTLVLLGVLMPLWIAGLLLPTRALVRTLPFIAIVAVGVLVAGGFESLMSFGIVRHWSTWNHAWEDRNMRMSAAWIAAVLIGASLLRAWVLYRMQRRANLAETTTDAAVARARARLAARRRDGALPPPPPPPPPRDPT